MKKQFSFNPDDHKDAPEAWRGAWSRGVDFSGKSDRVVAVHAGGDGDIKYGYNWIGPIDLRVEGAPAKLEAWATLKLETHGGYVHLLPADGDARADLDEQVEEMSEEL